MDRHPLPSLEDALITIKYKHPFLVAGSHNLQSYNTAFTNVFQSDFFIRHTSVLSSILR